MAKKQKNSSEVSSPSVHALCEKYASDWEHCELKGFIGNVGLETKNAKLIMMNNSPIPCCAEKCREDEKCTPIKLTVVNCHSAGFSAAPYSVPFGGGKGKVGTNAKPLTVAERVEGPNNCVSTALRMWPFKKESMPGNRGVRLEESSYLIQNGDTFIMFVSKMDFMKSPHSGENKNSLFPNDIAEIPAFSLLEVHCITKAGDAYVGKDGKLQAQTMCLRFTMLRPLASTLYSYIDVLGAFPLSLEGAKQNALQKKENNEIISRLIETTDVVFFQSDVLPTAVLSDHALESHGFVSVVGWSADPLDSGVNIDIPKDTLLAYANTDRLDFATTLLEIAINMRCVRFLVFTSDYFKKDTLSHLRAIPILDTRKMFSVVKLAECVDSVVDGGAAVLTFDTKCVYRNDEGVDLPIRIQATLPADYVSLEGSSPPPSRDLIVCSKNFAVPKALPFAFMVGASSVLRGFLRVNGTEGVTASGLKRTRIGCSE